MTLNINWTAIASGLQQAAAFASSPEVAALAALGGPTVAGAAKIVEGVAAVSSDLLATAETAGEAIASGDLEKIRAADAIIQAQITAQQTEIDAL